MFTLILQLCYLSCVDQAQFDTIIKHNVHFDIVTLSTRLGTFIAWHNVVLLAHDVVQTLIGVICAKIILSAHFDTFCLGVHEP
jgi:hypothetical protein